MNEAVTRPTSSEGTAPLPSAGPTPSTATPLSLGRRWWAVAVAVARRPWRLLAALLLLALIAGAVAFIGFYFWADSHLRAARAEVEHGHVGRARPHLQAYLWLWPKNADALLLAARTARRSGEFEEADDFLSRYEAVRGKDDPDLILERVLLLAHRGEGDRVRPFCRDRLANDGPDTSLILEAQAAGLMRSWRVQEANECVGLWLDRRPDDANAHYYHGLAADLQNRTSEAIDSYQRALDLDPDHDEARLRLADDLIHVIQADKALPLLERLQSDQPDNLLVPVRIAECRIQLGDHEEAKKLLDAVLVRQPDFAEALAARGQLAFDDGQYEQAADWLRKALAREPGNHDARFKLVECLSKLGKDVEGRDEAAYLKAQDEDLKAIQKILSEEIPKAPKDPEVRYRVGMIALRAGAVRDAVRWFKEAVELDPDYGPAHKMLAEYYQRTGSPTKAAEERRRAGEKGP